MSYWNCYQLPGLDEWLAGESDAAYEYMLETESMLDHLMNVETEWDYLYE